MKNACFTVLFLFLQVISAQNIVQIRTYPANPSSNDSVLILADLQFTSTGCDLDNKYHQVNGTSIVASTHHCVGIAAAICNTTDTFELGILPAGNYSFNLTLTHGGAPAPCTPGIAISDSDTLGFTVQQVLSLEDAVLPSFSVYPNPAQDFISLSDGYKPIISSLKVLTVTGAVVFESDTPKDRIDVSELVPGIYYVELHHSTGVITEKFIKE